ncbi:hypothetical protein [Rubinisphaera margarita]|uniref:hypothetical protein n=1 Tax=Rubinisphaera margarita TaxID=2909586 RepID=UPI001EE96E22|nr:hypothetical protein [Rubinisphaera margarita]MCG6156883.1 hypothetical protein [Rubinisphaera margarita]
MNAPLEDVVCFGCGLGCDDLSVELSTDSLDVTSGSKCGRKWMEDNVLRARQLPPTDLQNRIQQARDWLTEAHQPLLTGCRGMTLNEQATAVRLAEATRMIVATTSSSESQRAYVHFGGATCTFGEIRQRCDVLLCLNVDVFDVWPRFEEKLLAPESRFLKDGAPRRVIYVGDPERLALADRYAEIYEVDSADLLTLLLAWREALQSDSETEDLADVGQFLAKLVTEAAYPVLLHGSLDERLQIQVAALIADASRSARLHALPVSSGPAAGSFSDTLLAMCGFPDHICFNETGVDYDPQRWTPSRLLERNEADLVVCIGELPEALRSPAADLRVIHLHNGDASTSSAGNIIELTYAPSTITVADSLVRADGLPLPTRTLVASAQPLLTELLSSLQRPT